MRPGGFTHGVAVAPEARPPRTAPFYALRVQPSITFTFGGVRIDADARVVDPDGHAVPGLFAAGADVGGLSNVGYAGGLAPAYITGRWAGRSAAVAADLRPALGASL
jgi:predicted oxidoreductase